MPKINLPGAVWVALAAVLMAVQSQLQGQYPNAEWLPIALAVIGFVAKWIQVNRGESTEKLLPDASPDLYAPNAVPLVTLEEEKPGKLLKFLVG